MILEDVLPIAMEIGNLIEMVNSMKEDLDDEKSENNIAKSAAEGDLCTDQVQSLNIKHGKKKKRIRIKSASIM